MVCIWCQAVMVVNGGTRLGKCLGSKLFIMPSTIIHVGVLGPSKLIGKIIIWLGSVRMAKRSSCTVLEHACYAICLTRSISCLSQTSATFVINIGAEGA